MSNELAITNEELMSLTGEIRQGGGESAVKFVKLVQEIKNGAAERYGNLIALAKAPEEKKRLQEEMLKEMEKEVPLGAYAVRDGKDEAGNDLMKALGNPFVGQILKTRYSWATKYGTAPAYRTSETDILGGMVKVYDGFKNELEEMPAALLPLKYPDPKNPKGSLLKRQDHLYVWEETTRSLYKFTVKGDSFSNWFAYCNVFPKGTSKASFETAFGSEKKRSPDGKDYYVMTFRRGAPIGDMKATVERLRDLNSLLGTSHVSAPQEKIVEAEAPPAAQLGAGEATAIAGAHRLKERRKSIESASEAAEKRSEKESEDMPPDFLSPDKE